MLFTKDNVKYCLLTFDQPTKSHIQFFAKDKLCISGLYLWAKAFKGTFGFPVFPEDTEEFNLIHVNITPRNIPLMSQLTPMINRKKTKLLLNVDHSIDLWQTAFPYPQQLLETLDKADFLFGVEPDMCGMLSEALKRRVECIPHPVDTEQITKLKQHDRDQRIGVSIHRYLGNYILPWYGLKNLPKGWVTTAIGAETPEFKPKVHHLFPEVQGYIKFEKLMPFIATLYAMVESYTIRSYGRLTLECAALAVPVIGGNCVSSQGRCFPELTMGGFKTLEVQKLLKRLIEDPAFYTAVVQKGLKEVETVSLENSKTKMIDFLNSPQ